MNSDQAIHKFFSSFGLKAYDENSVPDENDENSVPDNYITYPLSTGVMGYPLTNIPSLWYKSTSWEEITLKAKEIMDGIDGHVIDYDGGAIFLNTGSFKYQRINSGDDRYKRMLLNIQMEFLER